MIEIYINSREARRLMRIRGYTQRELAAKIGMNPVYFNRLIMARAPVGVKSQRKIESCFRCVKFDLLFTIVDKPRKNDTY
jgi:transcriptional regulator with XRE-family HTH domain